MERRRLHSLQTQLLKFVFPTVYLIGLAVGLPLVFAGTGTTDPSGILSRGEIQVVAVLAALAGAGLLVWGVVRPQFVWMDHNNLHVSKLIREATVPLADIQDVTENCWLSIHPVTVHLAHATHFGPTITFIPEWRPLYWQHHPVVDDILEAAAAARRQLAPRGPAA
ncbi:MAG TPA: hypothetical protein VMT29_17740 [Steroidobacteraceae bacterium]|nr:hypothetical protein [Steroidobacteraceae bacterium]